jgi:hypothetical protein
MGKLMEELRKKVQEVEKEVLLTTGEELRLAAGESRLKEKARERVASALESEGLLAVPDVPGSQGDEVYLTSLTSELGLLFGALNNPGEDNLIRRVLPAVGSDGGVAEHMEAVEELGELLDDAQELVTRMGAGGDNE